MSHAAKARTRERSPGEVGTSCPLPRHVTSAKYLNLLQPNISGRHVTYFHPLPSKHVCLGFICGTSNYSKPRTELHVAREIAACVKPCKQATLL
jgi:hypothetical protein